MAWGDLVEPPAVGGHQVPRSSQEGEEEVAQGEEDAHHAHEGVQGAAAAAHTHIHHLLRLQMATGKEA